MAAPTTDARERRRLHHVALVAALAFACVVLVGLAAESAWFAGGRADLDSGAADGDGGERARGGGPVTEEEASSMDAALARAGAALAPYRARGGDADAHPVPPEYRIDPDDEQARYFVYQPSGGWGNQRFILRWAMRAANAMDRILVVPPIAPHSMMWRGYANLSASDVVGAHRVLDLDALRRGLVRGLRVHVGRLAELRGTQSAPGPLRKKRWKVWTRPPGGLNWLPANAIRAGWRRRPEDVVFWQKGSMWLCCAGGEMMTPYVMFSRELKSVAEFVADELFGSGVPFDAVHVRRADGHTRIDRRTAQHYIERHLKPNGMHGHDGAVALYVATDEKRKEWFAPFRGVYRRVVFWGDAEALPGHAAVRDFIASFPARRKWDFVGFIEQQLCTRARKWEGSDGSTFTAANWGMRKFPTMKVVEWERLLGSNPRLAEVYSGDGEGGLDAAASGDAPEREPEKEAVGGTGEEAVLVGEERS